MLVDKAFLLSDFMFHTKNLTFIINSVLLDNDYPLTFIFDTIKKNQRIKNLLKNSHIAHKDLVDNVCAN